MALPNATIASPPTPTPDASQWNIGGVGSSGIGHIYFMYISSCLCIIFRVGYAKISRRKGRFQWNMGLKAQFFKNIVGPNWFPFLQVTVLEARDRIGGRVWDDDEMSIRVGHGAMIIVGHINNPITLLCEQVGLVAL